MDTYQRALNSESRMLNMKLGKRSRSRKQTPFSPNGFSRTLVRMRSPCTGMSSTDTLHRIEAISMSQAFRAFDIRTKRERFEDEAILSDALSETVAMFRLVIDIFD